MYSNKAECLEAIQQFTGERIENLRRVFNCLTLSELNQVYDLLQNGVPLYYFGIPYTRDLKALIWVYSNVKDWSEYPILNTDMNKHAITSEHHPYHPFNRALSCIYLKDCLTNNLNTAMFKQEPTDKTNHLAKYLIKLMKQGNDYTTIPEVYKINGCRISHFYKLMTEHTDANLALAMCKFNYTSVSTISKIMSVYENSYTLDAKRFAYFLNNSTRATIDATEHLLKYACEGDYFYLDEVLKYLSYCHDYSGVDILLEELIYLKYTGGSTPTGRRNVIIEYLTEIGVGRAIINEISVSNQTDTTIKVILTELQQDTGRELTKWFKYVNDYKFNFGYLCTVVNNSKLDAYLNYNLNWEEIEPILKEYYSSSLGKVRNTLGYKISKIVHRESWWCRC